MRKVDDIIEQAKRLTPEERRRLVEALEEVDEPRAEIEEAKRLAAFDRFLARGGKGHSDFRDVSRDKYKHLAEVYADKK